ncbi:MAG: CocE/NonD family hydrolase [Gemmatimonadota bacterium]|nr:CocE/NonD family hydrolase [Gemmatimonadota bacterium]
MARRLAVAVVVLAAPPCRGQAADPGAAFTKTNAQIVMRDGARLNTDIYVPKGATAALPIIFLRTPYGIDGAAGRFASSLKELAEEGYIFAFQDIRGRFRSEGSFVMQRPPRTDRANRKSVDESTDAYDTIDWLIKNVRGNSGRVGMLGVSYDGWLTAMAMLDPHPALRAVSPQASPADMYLGDDFHHNGAFRLSYGFEYASEMESTKENSAFPFDRYDTYEWYLRLGPLSNVNAKYFRGRIPTWNDFVSHPDYDGFWKRQAMAGYLTRVTVPTLNVAGWWDQEDFYGPVKIYETLEQRDTRQLNFLVVGPWNHGGWSRGEGATLGKIDFGGATARYYREKIQAPWFAFHLKDKGPLKQPEAITFEAGANAWRSWDAWPPKNGVSERNLYFHAGEQLSFDAPTEAGDQAFDSYVSDPAHPVPYRARPIEPTYYARGSGWPIWLLEDQRFVHERPDVLSWETEPLESDVTIAGRITAHLFASTSGTDSDWIVKLIDVYPDSNAANQKMGGYQLMVANDVLRGRYRRSFETPEAAVPNQPAEYVVDLHTQDYRFLKGHRIMVQVQSSWFPIIDRNPQTFVANIFEAPADAYRSATQRVFRTVSMPSRVTVSVVTSDSLRGRP